MTNKDFEGAEASFLAAQALMPEDKSVRYRL
jgi:Flp pilus assembly protein TadD